MAIEAHNISIESAGARRLTGLPAGSLWPYFLLPGLFLFFAFFSAGSVTEAMELSGDLRSVALRPWTMVTYGFLHETVFHLLLAVALLSLVVRLSKIGARAYWGLFLGGTLCGGVSFLLLFPLTGFEAGTLVGASAGICALAPLTLYSGFAHRGKSKGHPLAWVMVAVLAADFGSFLWMRSPGFLAHLGGYILGVFALARSLKVRRSFLKTRKRRDELARRATQSGLSALSKEERDLLFAPEGGDSRL